MEPIEAVEPMLPKLVVGHLHRGQQRFRAAMQMMLPVEVVLLFARS